MSACPPKRNKGIDNETQLRNTKQPLKQPYLSNHKTPIKELKTTTKRCKVKTIDTKTHYPQGIIKWFQRNIRELKIESKQLRRDKKKKKEKLMTTKQVERYSSSQNNYREMQLDWKHTATGLCVPGSYLKGSSQKNNP